MIAFLLGDYARAATLSENLKSDGGRYINALAKLRLGDRKPAEQAAALWALSYEPEQVFLAASLYLATSEYDKVIETLTNPQRRLHRDYTLSGGTDIFGNHIDPAPLHIDLFGEFGFGLMKTYSYAPQGNAYVSYALAKSELETGQIDAARKRYDTILSFDGDRARISEREGNVDGALDLYEQSVGVIESARSSISTDAGRIGFVGDKQEVYANLVRLLLAQGQVDRAFEYSERARSRALVDLLGSVQTFGARGVSRSETDEALQEFQRAEITLREARRGTETKSGIDTRVRGLTAIGRRLVRKAAPEVTVLVRVNPQTLGQIQASLGRDEALLSYFRAGSQWAAWITTRHGHDYVNLGPLSLNEDIIAFRYALEQGKPYQEASHRLYERLIEPIEGIFPDEKLPRQLTIIPFGSLHYLPFAALLDDDNKFLVEKYILSTLPSAGVRRFLVVGHNTPRILVVGDPERKGEEPLPGAENEARLVAAKYKSPTLLLHERATKAEFLRSAPRYGILHIASHGEFDPELPLQSYLALAPDSPEEDLTEGDLTVVDLFKVEPAWRVNIAVLSACNTAFAAVSDGNDIIGLQRGFLYAGTDSLVGTLWRITDEGATLYLMDRFYLHLNRGAPASWALQQAQIDTRRRYPHPKNWAAFTYTGLNT